MNKYNHDIALAFLLTQQDYESGRLKRCLYKMFVEYPASLNHSFSFYFIFNNFFNVDINDIIIDIPLNVLGKAKLHFLKIDSKDDKYQKRGAGIEAESKLGLSAGPNSLFFGAMNFLKKSSHSHFLMLETDVLSLKYYWLDKLLSFSRSNDFLIAGSTYKGLNLHCAVTNWKHINGVAIYTNKKFLFSLLDSVKLFLINEIAQKRSEANLNGKNQWLKAKTPSEINDWFKKQDNNKKRTSLILNYDVAIYKYCQNIGPNLFDTHHTSNRIIDTDLILDLSLTVDKKTSVEEVKSRFPSAVLCHKK